MHSVLLAGALALLCCNNVESFTTMQQQQQQQQQLTGCTPSKMIPGFVNGRTAVAGISRKRPRGYITGTSAATAAAAGAGAPVGVMAGSFTAARLPGDGSAWFGGGGKGRRRRGGGGGGGGGGACRSGDQAGQGGPRMLFGLGFHPPDFGVFLEGTVKAIMLGGFAALIPTVTAERIREKEDGLVVDEAFEAGLFDDDDDEYGYAGGYVCPTCDNTNEVECPKCDGKGFFVSASAMPKKCNFCDGLGTLPCPDCEDRRERLKRERGARRAPPELPPSRGEDFPVTW